MVGALGLAVVGLARMPPPVPPTTPTGTGLPEAALDDPDLPPLPITMATTTATTTTAAMIAPMMTGFGPLFGVAFAIFLEASGRIWWSPLSEQTVIEAVGRARANDQPRGAGCEPCVAQYLPRVVRLRGRDGSPAAKTAAVEGIPVGPGPADSENESQHQQAAHRCGHPREKAGDQEQTDQDLKHWQGVANITGNVVVQKLIGTHRLRRDRRMGHLGRTGPDENDPQDQPGQKAYQVGQSDGAPSTHGLSAPLGR